MPGDIAGPGKILGWIAQELSPMTYVNLMTQYYPAGNVMRSDFPEIKRRVTPVEYERVSSPWIPAGTRLRGSSDPSPLAR
jgi:putative pyruvate formate lyase activating enzyme